VKAAYPQEMPKTSMDCLNRDSPHCTTARRRLLLVICAVTADEAMLLKSRSSGNSPEQDMLRVHVPGFNNLALYR